MELLINYCRKEEHSAYTKPTELCLSLKSFYSPVKKSMSEFAGQFEAYVQEINSWPPIGCTAHKSSSAKQGASLGRREWGKFLWRHSCTKCASEVLERFGNEGSCTAPGERDKHGRKTDWEGTWGGMQSPAPGLVLTQHLCAAASHVLLYIRSVCALGCRFVQCPGITHPNTLRGLWAFPYSAQ